MCGVVCGDDVVLHYDAWLYVVVCRGEVVVGVGRKFVLRAVWWVGAHMVVIQKLILFLCTRSRQQATRIALIFILLFRVKVCLLLGLGG